MRGVVDRLEGDLVVCEMDGQVMENLPASVFSKTPVSGTMFEYENGKATILQKETLQQTETARSLFQKLKKKK